MRRRFIKLLHIRDALSRSRWTTTWLVVTWSPVPPTPRAPIASTTRHGRARVHGRRLGGVGFAQSATATSLTAQIGGAISPVCQWLTSRKSCHRALAVQLALRE